MNKGQSDNQVVKQKLKCYHCRKFGHVISDCWELKGYPKSDGKNPPDLFLNEKNKMVTLIIEVIM